MTLQGFLILLLLLSHLEHNKAYDDDDDDDDNENKRTTTKKENQEPIGCRGPAPPFLYGQHNWSPWTHWSHCSVTCGVGIRSRSRKCLDITKATDNVAQFLCLGASTEEITCTQRRCHNENSGKPETFEDQSCEGQAEVDDLHGQTVDAQVCDEINDADGPHVADGPDGDGPDVDGPEGGDGFEDVHDNDEFRGPRERADSLGDGGASDRGHRDQQDDNAEGDFVEDNDHRDEQETAQGDQDGQDGPEPDDGQDDHDGPDADDQGDEIPEDHEKQERGQRSGAEGGDDLDDDDVASQGDGDNSADDMEDEGGDDEEDRKSRKGRKKRYMEDEEEEEEEDKDEEEEKEEKRKKKKKKKKKKKRKKSEPMLKDKTVHGMTSADEHSPDESLTTSLPEQSGLSAKRLQLKPPSEDVLRIRSRSSTESDSDSDSLVSYEESPDSDDSAVNMADKVSLAETEGSLADNEASFRDASFSVSRDCSLEDIHGIASSPSATSLQKILVQCSDSLKEISDRCSSNHANSVSDIGDVLDRLDSHESVENCLNSKAVSSTSLDTSSSSNENQRTLLDGSLVPKPSA